MEALHESRISKHLLELASAEAALIHAAEFSDCLLGAHEDVRAFLLRRLFKVEKPLDVSSAKAREIMAAAVKGKAKLMTAYRLHFEPATLDAIRRIRAGELGDLIAFTACFTQMVDPANHRAKNGIEAGPLFDMAPYPINAIRYLFGAEPVEVVSAVGTRHPGERVSFPVEGVDGGSISMLAVQVG